jgi:hypothetical protein
MLQQLSFDLIIAGLERRVYSRSEFIAITLDSRPPYLAALRSKDAPFDFLFRSYWRNSCCVTFATANALL